MKRDFDLIRRILLEMESENESPSGWIDLEIEEWPEDMVAYHVWLLFEAGLIEAQELSSKDGYAWKPKTIRWEGHEFLDSARNDKAWARVMKRIKKLPETVSFSVLQIILQKSALKMMDME